MDKQKPIEQAAERIALMEIKLNHIKTLLASCEKALENRDNQAKRMYSEEEVNEIIAETWNSCEDNEGETFTEAIKRILEQIKKK
jgi:hemerythrin-like domain-containing protein